MSLLSTFAAGSIRGFAAKFIPNLSNLYQWGVNIFNQISYLNPPYNFVPTTIYEPSQSFVILSSGSSHVNAIDSNGNLYGWGSNAQGQVGDNSGDNIVSSPVLVSATGDWVDVVSGHLFSIGLKSDGTLWGWGENSNGQLGQGNTTRRSAPTQIGLLTTWSSIACGYTHAAARRSDNTLWAWGNGAQGQLGQSNTTSYSSPVQISGTSWRNVGCNFYGTYGTQTANSAFGTGRGTNGQIGDLSAFNRSSMSQVAGGNVYSKPIQQGWSQNQMFFVRTDNIMVGTGLNTTGQLGNSTATSVSSPVIVGGTGQWADDLASTATVTVARSSTNGYLWSWGGSVNAYNGLGQAFTANYSSPVQVDASSWAFIQGSSTYMLGKKSSVATTLSGWGVVTSDFVQGRSPVSSVSQANRYLWDGSNRWSVVTDTSYMFMGVTVDNKLYAVGSETIYGQMGTNSITTVYKTPTQLGSSNNWSYVEASIGSNTTVALKTDGTLWAWGLNNVGQLGIGDVVTRSSPVQVGVQTDWVQASIGTNNWMLVRNATGQIYTTGQNNVGQLGQGNTTNLSSLTEIGSNFSATYIAAGFYASHAVKSNGTLWGWGYNIYGEVGDNTVLGRSSPVQIGALTNWAKVWGGHYATYAIKTDGTLWSWGYNGSAELGDNSLTNRSSPVQIGFDTTWESLYAGKTGSKGVLAKKANGTIWYWGTSPFSSATTQSSPVQVGSGTNWSSVYVGYNAAALTN